MNRRSPSISSTSEPGVSAIELASASRPIGDFKRVLISTTPGLMCDARRIDVAQHIDIRLHHLDDEDAGIENEVIEPPRRNAQALPDGTLPGEDVGERGRDQHAGQNRFRRERGIRGDPDEGQQQTEREKALLYPRSGTRLIRWQSRLSSFSGPDRMSIGRCERPVLRRQTRDSDRIAPSGLIPTNIRHAAHSTPNGPAHRLAAEHVLLRDPPDAAPASAAPAVADPACAAWRLPHH